MRQAQAGNAGRESRPRWWGILAACLIVGAAASSGARAAEGADVSGGGRPRLVVLLVVDQLRADLVTRFEEHYVDGGFRKLMTSGAHFTNAHFSYASSATAPGHATIASGRLPRHHGIVANDWYRGPEATDSQAAVFDPDTKIVGLDGEPPEGRSPRMLLGSTIGDQMKLADRRTLVYSIGLKDRGSILLGGHRPDGAFWWDEGTGRFVTSTYYAKELPAFVAAFNAERPSDRWSGQSWEPLLPVEAYAGAWPLDASWSQVLATVGKAFPHELPELKPDAARKYYVALFNTPFANELVLQLARKTIDEAALGADGVPDLLCLALSANDLIGHTYGPQSAEVMDATVRTDRQLAEFFAFLEEKIGLARCLVVLTADHGVTANPHVAAQVGIDGGLVDGKKLLDGLNKALLSASDRPESEERLVLGLKMPWIYCTPSLAELDAASDGKVGRAGVAYLRQHPGIAAAFCGSELVGPPPAPDDSDRQLAWRCYHDGRSGYFLVKLKPFHYLKSGDIAGHGAGYRSDRHVPIMLMGPGVRPGRLATPADPQDVAVTIANLLGIEAPAEADGRVLHESLAPHVK